MSAFIVPDLPLEECDELRSALEARGLGLVQMITPVTPADRRRRLREESRGFTYAVTVTGVTGGEAGLPRTLTDLLRAARGEGAAPLLAGFGIRRRAQVDALSGITDGVVVGSALLEALQSGGDPAAVLRALR